ncbi:protein distal antenna-like isoform X2 [Anopheles merus]|uniref:protein distal antenna-like isoform X2 n=1 Tax=Anopheles merus TaxID=30066 RepID=UPI001BE4102C|nr:protein distal antenna-like isoform X2 [Anopheles merus]
MMMMATATKGKRPLRHLTATDKIDAIQRIHDGESKASVARDIGVPESTLRGWCKNEEKLRYMSRQSVENAEKLSNEATAAALTAAAAAELFSGPPEKRLKLESAMFGGNGKLKYDDSFYKVAAAARGSLNGLDLSGGGGGAGGAGSGVDKSGALGVSGGDIIMNGLAGASPADFSQFAKTAAEMSALSKSKAYGAELGKHHHHGGDPSKADHHLSMAAISPLTSLSHLSGMSGLGQSPLALSFNDIATNLNLIAQLNNNHSLATMSSLAGGLNTAAAAAAAAQSLRNVRPKGSGSSAANNNGGTGGGNGRGSNLQDSSNGGGGGGGGTGGSATGTGNGGTDKSSAGGSTGPSLTVRNLAKLQQQKSSSGELLGNGRDPNAAPVDDALWYWLKSQQAMLGLNNLYTALPRAASHSPPTPPPPLGLNSSVTAGAGSPNQTALPPTAHTPHTPPPPLVGPPLVSTPQPTPPSSAPSLTPEDTKNSSWFWQWYKTFGASLMPGGGTGGGGTGSSAVDSKQALREQQQQQAAQQAAIAAALHHHNNNNNSLSQQNQNSGASGQKGGAAATAASLTAAYENILYSQLTKGSSAVDTLNNNHHHHLNHHLSAHLKDEPMDLNIMGGAANDGDSKPEDLSNHHAGSGKAGNGDERRSRYHPHPNSPSRPSSASSVASSAMSAHGSREGGGERLLRPVRTSEERANDDELAAALDDGEEREAKSSVTAVVEATSTDACGGLNGLEEHDEEEMEEEEDDDEERAARIADGPRVTADDEPDQGKVTPAPEDERKRAGLKRRRCSSTDAKEALDNILFSGNSNDRCSTTSSAAPSPPPPLLAMVVHGGSISPTTGTALTELNGGGGDELTGLDAKGEATTTGADDAKSETSEDSNHGQQSVAVADIRNSAEAVEHGEKFLKWLEACSDPNVTAMQVMQFKYLLNSIKLSAERQLQTATAGSALAGAGTEERTRIRKRK